jgi:alkylhydroperoxidase family enzyme
MARVPYVDSEDVPPEHRDLLVSSLQDRPLHVYRALGNNPAVLAGLRSFFAALWSDTGLRERERELVILAAARERENAYEWHQHVRIAGSAGVNEAEMRAIADGDLGDFDDREAALIGYARAVVRDAVTDERHAAVAAEYDDATVVGIAALAGGYAMLGGLIDAFDLELEEGESFFGWRPGGGESGD